MKKKQTKKKQAKVTNKKIKRKFPNPNELDRLEDIFLNEESSFMLSPDSTAVEKAKYDVCKHILVFMHSKGLSQRELAKTMGIPETRVSEIVHYKITKFTLDKLLSYYEELNPKVSLLVS